MLKWVLWMRLLRKRRIVLLSVAAVALSVGLLCVVTSLFTGFIRAYEQGAVDLMGDVLLDAGMKFPRSAELIRRLEQTSAVEAATATLVTEGLVNTGPGQVRAVQVWGIEPRTLSRVTRLKSCLLRQAEAKGYPDFNVPDQAGPAPGRVGGFAGIGVLAEPSEQTDQYDVNEVLGRLGQRMVLTLGAVRPTQGQGGLPDVQRTALVFHLSDVVFTGIYTLDHDAVYVPLEALHRELNPDQADVEVQRIQIKTRPGVTQDQARTEIQGVWRSFAATLGWPKYRIEAADVLTSKELQADYLAEIHKQLAVLQMIFGVVDFGAVVLVFCIFYMIVRLKYKDVAILKSCGGSSGSVAALFWGFGLVVSTVGALAGVAIGYAFTKNLNAIERWISCVFGLKLWDSSVYLFRQIPEWMNWPAAVVIAVVVALAASAGAVFPALMAARARPVEILRYE